MAETYTIEAILSARDAGYRKALGDAANQAKTFSGHIGTAEKKSSGFMDTMKGMVAAVGVTKAIAGAWNLVKNSVGSAMDRIDTMDAFRRSIMLMSGDADAAAKAIAEISEIAKGTAYGLDVMSSATQKFVTSSSSIGDSVKYVERWGNAVGL